MFKKMLIVLSFVAAPAQAFDVGVMGGYDSISQDDNFGGGSVSVFVDGPVYSTGNTSLKLGADIGHQNVSKEDDGVELTLKNTYLGGFVGLDTVIYQRLHILNTIGYEVGINGKYKIESDDLKTTGTIDSYKRLNYGIIGLFSVAPKVDLGAGVRWYQGSFDMEDYPDTMYFHGYQLQMMASVMLF